MDTQHFIDLENRYGAQNYKPLDVVLNRDKDFMIGVELFPEAGGVRGFCERLWHKACFARILTKMLFALCHH